MCFSEDASFLTPDWIIEATYSPSAHSEEYPPKIHSTEVKGNNVRNLVLTDFTQKKTKKTADTTKIAAQDDVRGPQMWTRGLSISSSCQQQDSQFPLHVDGFSLASLSSFFASSDISLGGFLTNEPLV